MTTTKKVVLGATAAAVIYLATRKKKTDTSTTTTTLAPSVQAAVNTNPFENKLIVEENGSWFVVHNGKRWYTSNVAAIVDFQKAYPGNDTPIQGVASADLIDIPIAGAILPGLVYQENQLSMPSGLGLNWQVCRRRNADGSHTEYGGQGGDRPCPYGGTPYYPYRDKQKSTTITGV